VFGGALIVTLVVIPAGIGGLGERIFIWLCTKLGWVEGTDATRVGSGAMGRTQNEPA
jgi:hypothetical protein